MSDAPHLLIAWSADRRALVAVAVSELGQGIAAAVGLLAINAVMHALLGAGDTFDRLHALLPGLLAAAGVAVVNSALAGWSTSRAGRLEPVVERIATTQYPAAATSVELEAIDDPDFRRLIDIAQYGPASARRMIGACVSALNSTISLIATAGVLTVLNPTLLPMLLVIAAPRGWGAMRVAQERYVSVMSWIEHLRASRLIGNLLTERTAAQEVRIHAVGPFLLERYRRMAASAESEQERLASSKAVTEWVASALSGLAMAATYGTMIWLIMAGHMSLAVAGTAVIAVRTGSASLGALVMNINQLHEESLYVRDHGQFLIEAAQRAIPETGSPVPDQVKQVSLEHVTYQYPDRDAPALDDVTLTFPMGSVIAVVGENGSGKSTLMKILSGLLLPHAGSVRSGEFDVSGLDRRPVAAARWRRRTRRAPLARLPARDRGGTGPPGPGPAGCSRHPLPFTAPPRHQARHALSRRDPLHTRRRHPHSRRGTGDPSAAQGTFHGRSSSRSATTWRARSTPHDRNGSSNNRDQVPSISRSPLWHERLHWWHSTSVQVVRSSGTRASRALTVKAAS